MKIAVGIATAGRPDLVAKLLGELAKQQRLPDEIVVCPASTADCDTALVPPVPIPTRYVFGGRGTSCQRNTIVQSLDNTDLLVFFDDDFVPATDYLTETELLFLSRADIGIARGTVIQDGISGPGIAFSEAVRIVESLPEPQEEVVKETYGAYGCNFAVRLELVRQHSVFFDEQLPLYGWQEDIDFSRQIARHARVVWSNRLRGVHMGTKSGRTSGLRFGYSQIANPIYLIQKGTMSMQYGLSLMMRNVCANVVRSMWPEPWVDRRGRLRGNALAFRDMFLGSLHPARILEM